MSTDPGRRVVVTAEAGELRRRLGTTAWVVFEELLLSSSGTEIGCVASVSVRSLAAALGLARDTVARALVRLRAAGLVAVTQARSTGGVFSAVNYELQVPSGIVLDDAPTPTHDTATPDEPASIARTTRPPQLTQSTRSTQSTGSQQLALVLDA